MGELVAAYERWAGWVAQTTGLSDAALHVHAGMALMLLARVITRRSLGSWTPVGLVAAAALANEVIDWLHHGRWRWGDTGPDLLSTLFWPAAVFLAVRLRPAAGGRRRR